MAATHPMQAPAQVSFRAALSYWLRLGLMSFGGPAGQISLMHQELVEQRRWISERRFLHALNYCMVLPGPEAQQLATYIGWLMHGIKGGISAGVLFVAPSLIILITLSWIYLAFGDVPAVAGVFYGIKPAVTAIVAFAAYRIGARVLHNAALWTIAVCAFLALFALQAPFPLIILGAALTGYAGGRLAPELFQAPPSHGGSTKDYGPALIDEHTPPPAHTAFNGARFFSIVAVGIVLWAGVLGGLALKYGFNGALTQMGWFFTKAALLTFGGAYAVLPYVFQGAVEHYHWLTAAQMMDGLALGETTPGPLIMVVAFVGFVGAWGSALLGPDMLVLAGIAGACVATFFTFLPSFLFILLGAPLVEATRHEIKLTAPLTAITAAITGVILNLALFFAYHVLWPRGFEERFEWFAAVVVVGAFVALFRYRVGVIPVIAVCGTLGMIHSLIL
ncbi:MAG: chromate efflux transporter [Gammaproteobacteria bacterium]|nr:chromate efflux transporter [Gammaproteobacteria bacterium]